MRRALAHAFSQKRQVEIAYKNSIPVVHHPFGHRCRCIEDAYRQHDPESARNLLSEVGRSISLEVLHSSSKRGRDIGEITQQLFKNVGVSSRPLGLSFGPIIKRVISGEYQMSTWRISSRPDQGPALFMMFHSKSRANFSRYQNTAMDDLLTAQRMEMAPEKREEILCRIAALINEDVPVLYRGGMRSHVIAKRLVRGITGSNDGIVRLKSVWMDR